MINDVKEEIDTTVTKILSVIEDINSTITLKEGSVGYDIGVDEYIDQFIEDNELYAEICLRDEAPFLKVSNWHSHSICLSGLVFTDSIPYVKRSKSDQTLNFSAITQDGVGDRYIYKALGNKLITIAMDVDPINPHENYNDGEYLHPLTIKSASVQFPSEDEQEMNMIREMLRQQDLKLQTQLTQSMVTGNYLNFHKSTGLSEEDFFKPIVPNQNFDKFFGD